MEKTPDSENIHDYGHYIELDQILNAQKPRSSIDGKPAHDEMLFIIIHQVYELWFKQILHELGTVVDMFDCNFVDEMSIGVAVSRLRRVVEIEKLLIEQIHVLETMTPLDFLEFRGFLTGASGFQSYQFRMLEHKLGLRHEQRIPYDNRSYDADYSGSSKKKISEVIKTPSLFEVVERWLERTPFLSLDGFDFLANYKLAVDSLHEEERKAIRAADFPEELRELKLKMVAQAEAYIYKFIDPVSYEALRTAGEVRLSHKAFMAALFINLYRDQPILQLPFQLLSSVVDVDEQMDLWRYRHVLMVLRMLGKKMGTGGSTGHDYLQNTIKRHKVFSDLFNLSTLLIPRSSLPALPEKLIQNLGFHFSVTSAAK